MRLVFDTRIRNAFIAAMAAATCSCTMPVHDSARATRADPPPTECKAWVGTDRDAELQGYLVGSTCVPLLVTANRPPPDDAGNDYYVDEFTDAKLKARWAACKQDAACFRRIDAQMQRWLPPNKERATRATGVVDPSGNIDPEGNVDLRQIRRPAFFAKAPYREAIAAADNRTWIVEFTVPRDTFERLDLDMHDTIRLRGWYLEGNAAGGKLHDGMKSTAIPIVLAGNSRGSMSTAWAMTKNFSESCTYDMPNVVCAPPKGLTNIKGAILLASFASGAGYLPAAQDLVDRNLFLGGRVADHHIQFYPNSATLA